jgi:hypothetical protein
MLKTFNQFIFESRGFSKTVGEYSQLVKNEIDRKVEQFLKIDFRKRRTIFSQTILIDDAKSKVSPEASSEFPLDDIGIIFRIVPVKQNKFGPYQAYYLRNYDKVKIKKARLAKNKKVGITIMCKLYVPTDLSGEINRSLLNEYITDILNHEITHAFNDYRDPNFLKSYRLGMMHDYSIEAYEFIKHSWYLRNFFTMLYVFTDQEINAISGERAEFKTIEEFNNYNGTKYARMGIEYDSDEYYDAIWSELGRSSNWAEINQTFGQIFSEIYTAFTDDEMSIDPKILKLSKSASLKDVLRYFESYINERAKTLFEKLSRKITQQGEGSLN